MRGGVIMFVTRNTLTQIKGTRLEALFSGRWDKRLPREKDSNIFLDINFTCFWAVVEYLNDCKITNSDCAPKMPHLGEEDDIVIQQLLLAFWLRDDGMEESKRLHKKTKLVQADDSINNHTKPS